jgi:hypothetical protein
MAVSLRLFKIRILKISQGKIEKYDDGINSVGLTDKLMGIIRCKVDAIHREKIKKDLAYYKRGASLILARFSRIA